MEIFKVALEEISLSGLEGCTIEELWIHLQDRQPGISFILDEPIKSYIWNQILSSIKPTVESYPIKLYLLPSPREPHPVIQSTTPPTPLDHYHPFNYRFISDSSAAGEIAVRGSCTSYHERKDATKDISDELLSVTSITEKYGNSLVLVASQELREMALLPAGADPCLEISDVQYGLLEAVGCARHRGVSRPFLTSKYLKVDARSTFFYVKQLLKRGLIIVKNQNRQISGSRTGAVAMLYLSSYELLVDDIPDRKEQFCALLSKSPYQCKPLKELYAELGKKVKPTKKELVESGHVEHVVLKDVAEEYANDSALANVKACRLIKLYVAKETKVVGGDVEEDDEEGDGDSSSKVPLVAELPLEVQGYRCIDNCGPAGITQQNFIGKRGLDLTRFANRGIVKNLIKKSKVTAIIQDSAVVRTVSLVAAGHARKNEDYQQLQAEALKGGMGEEVLPIFTGPSYFPPDVKRDRRERKTDKVKVELSEETPTVEPTNEVPPMISMTNSLLSELNVSAPDLTENGDARDQSDSKTPIDPKRSASPPSTLTVGSDSGSKGRHQTVMTYKQLKRTRKIIEYFEKYRVVSSLATLAKYLREEEHKEGHEHVLDSKTLNKIVARLISEHKLCSRQVTLSIDDSDQTVSSSSSDGPVTQTATLYSIPQATEEEIATAQEAALGVFKSVAFKRALKTKSKRAKKEDDSEGDSPDDELVDVPKIKVSSSRFQRLKHFHCYLWILAYGQGSGDSTSSHTSSQEHTLRSDCVLSKANFPWAAAVSMLQSASRGPGWLNFFDITQNMPLSLFLFLTRVTVGKVPARYLCYFQEEEELINTSLNSLPALLKKGVLFREGCRRDRTHVAHFLQLLEEMKLISIDGSYNPRDRSQLFAQLATTTSILDTSTCKPRRSFFLNEARSEFTEIPFTLSCVADLKRYWFNLQTICTDTAIILGERKVKGRKANPALHDTNPLLYCTADYLYLKRSDKVWMRAFNQRGFGAGGLPPLLFSHTSRNWLSHHYSLLALAGYDKATPTPAEPLPGISLVDLPFVDMDVSDGAGYPGGGVAEEGLPAAKRMKMSQGVRVTVPGSQVVRNDGGRGRERFRMKKVHKAVKTARKVISKQSQTTQRFKLFSEVSKVIEDDTLRREEKDKDSDERVNVVSSEKEERASWGTEQRDYLLSSYLACCLLHQRGGSRVTYSQIREGLQERFPSLKCKTNAVKTTAVKRLLSSMLRKSPQARSTLEIRMTECLREMETMGEDAPEPTFISMLEFANRRSESSRSILSQEMLLPRTLEELHKNHTIIGGSKPKKSCVLPAVQGEQEINQALISDLILATLGADESSYDQYKTFKLFESFPEMEVMTVLDQLRQLQLIKRRKHKMVGVPTKQSPLETQSYAINHNFYVKLEGHFPPSLLQDTADFYTQLRKDQGSSGLSQPGVGWLEDEDRLRVHGDRAKATTAAALLGASSLGVAVEEVRPVLPEPLFEEVANPDQQDEEEMMDSSALGEEEGDGGSDGEDKEEEEAKEESTLTREIMRKLKYATGGVSTLFGVGEGPMKPGHVEVEPAMSYGELFEPAQNKQNGRSCVSEEKMRESVTAGESHQSMAGAGALKADPMTMDCYLIVAKEQLQFEREDLLFARELYQVIDQSGSEAVQRSSLESHTALSHLPHSHSFDFHVQSMLNFGLIFRVGVSEECLVTRDYSGRWNMSVDDSHLHTLTSYRPWSALVPPHLNTTLLDKYQHGVLIHIMAHPGISLVDLMQHFSSTLHVHANGLREILQALELSNQVKCFRFPAKTRCALFENNDNRNDTRYSEYYEAVTGHLQ